MNRNYCIFMPVGETYFSLSVCLMCVNDAYPEFLVVECYDALKGNPNSMVTKDNVTYQSNV